MTPLYKCALNPLYFSLLSPFLKVNVIRFLYYTNANTATG